VPAEQSGTGADEERGCPPDDGDERAGHDEHQRPRDAQALRAHGHESVQREGGREDPESEHRRRAYLRPARPPRITSVLGDPERARAGRGDLKASRETEARRS
jgi:hypothetical protein